MITVTAACPFVTNTEADVKNKVVVVTTACPFVHNTSCFVQNAYPLVTKTCPFVHNTSYFVQNAYVFVTKLMRSLPQLKQNLLMKLFRYQSLSICGKRLCNCYHSLSKIYIYKSYTITSIIQIHERLVRCDDRKYCTYLSTVARY
ncbi:hypothetical protein [Nostoc sp.]|uniref:hypothetical protein n=1 Tax=Nostoc sp. TaxID=1180 RepID=UPI002FFA338F